MINIALIFAGGSGTRMGAVIPKQFLMLGDRPVLAHALGIYESHPQIDGIYLVVSQEYETDAREIVKQYGISKLRGIAYGGETAQDSIYNGLRFVAEREPSDAIVLLHDGARPYLTPRVVADNIKSVEEFGNAITYTPCYETIVISSDGKKADAMPARKDSYTAQAPQSFRLGEILAAHEKIRARAEGYTNMIDQATICFTLGIPIYFVEGCRGNVKVTTPEDLVALEALLKWRANQ